jgi:hypothetical protein
MPFLLHSPSKGTLNAVSDGFKDRRMKNRRCSQGIKHIKADYSRKRKCRIGKNTLYALYACLIL